MKLITITGPSGAGKGFLKDRIRQLWPFIYEPPWYTTRTPRSDEEHRGDRICISPNEFANMQTKDLFLLTDTVGNHQYGLLRQTLDQHPVCLTELRLHLLHATQHSNLFSIALVPESIDFLHSRLTKRGTESMQKIEERISIARQELPLIIENKTLFNFFLVVSAHNEHLVIGETLKTLKTIEPFINGRKTQ